MVEVPVAPARTVTLVGLAVTVKSRNVKVTVTDLVRDPLVPVTVAVFTPPELAVQDSVEVPEVPSVMLVGVRVHDRLLDVATVRLTIPVKPLTLVAVMVEVPVWPTVTVTAVGLAVRVKSWTVKVTVAVLVREPLVPVTVTV